MKFTRSDVATTACAPQLVVQDKHLSETDFVHWSVVGFTVARYNRVMLFKKSFAP